MYIYHTGLIGETIHAKIENIKSSIKSGDDNTESFSEVLRSKMTYVDTSVKPVGLSQNGEKRAADGSTLIYAINNADTDDTAAAVLGALGITGGESSLYTDAQNVLSSVTVLNTVKNSDNDVIIPQLLSFTERFNELLTNLNVQGTSSGYLYSNILKTAVSTGAEMLKKAGITASEDGKLTFDANEFDELGLDAFLTSVSAAVNSVSTYASTIKNNDSLLSSLTDTDDDTSSTADYMTSLLRLYNL